MVCSTDSGEQRRILELFAAFLLEMVEFKGFHGKKTLANGIFLW